MGLHASLGPSAADAWMTCPDYPNAVAGLIDRGSEFAAEGTAAHHIADTCLATGLDAFDFIGSTLKSDGYAFEWGDDDAEQLQPGIDQIRAIPGEFFGEHRVDLSHWLGDNQFGTLDRGVVGDDLITVGDLKWGRGQPVEAVGNKQIRLYALGFWWNVARHISAATRFRFIIDQPRCSGGGGEWHQTLDELLVFGEEARAAADRTRNSKGFRVASQKGCFWCLRRKQAPSEPGAVSGCKTYDEFNIDLIGSKFDELDDGELTLPDYVGLERRSLIVEHKGMIEKWLEHLHVATLNDALAGRPTPGRKAVAGRRSAAKYSDPEMVKAIVRPLVGDRAFNEKLKTPKQLQPEIDPEDWPKVEALIVRGQPKPILVHEDDARAALEPLTNKFDEEVED